MDTKDVSESSEMADKFRQIFDAAERSYNRLGEIPRDYLPTSLMVSQFNATKSAREDLGGMTHMITTTVPPAYPPCTRPVRALAPMPISKMRLHEHHRGKFVIVRTLTMTDRFNAITVIAEDEEGTAVMLQLYNQPEETTVKADDVLPQGSVCVIKEPFFKDTSGGQYSLRVDHIGDIVILPSNDTRVPEAWRSPRSIGGSSEQTRLQGNAAVAKQDWGTAERLYSEALLLAATFEEQQAALLNRSLTNLRLDRPEKALDDAFRARCGGNPTEKGLFREAKAHYAMEQFRVAEGKLVQVLDLNADNRDAKNELKKTRLRLHEMQTGEYAWNQMYKQAKATPPIIDCATYSAPVEVRASPGRGNGLFTTKPVKAGDLLLCEKAFAYCYADEDDPMGQKNIKVLVNISTKRMSMGGQANLVSSIVQKLHHNPRMMPRFMDLHRGGYRAAKPAEGEDRPVDTFLVERTISLNCFGAPRTTFANIPRIGDKVRAGHTTCGIWTIASHINHSCFENCCRSFIGDVMIVRASRDMPAGTELVFCYQSPETGDDYKATQKRLSSWGFTCDCELCLDKKATPKAVFLKRKALREDLIQAITGCGVRTSPAQERKCLRILGELDQCYPSHEGAPRLEHWDAYVALSRCSLQRGKMRETLERAIKALEAKGFILDNTSLEDIRKGSKPAIRRWGDVCSYTPNAFLPMSRAYEVLAPQFYKWAKDQARTAHVIYAGEGETAGTLYEDLK
ncbi:TPR domain-containing protein [Colletotrichum kahawae]|uniref:TPR domain-containing protein n=1 Tax=Colletotrichum kahawae TaxID=34407 RepID=A0AAE0D5Y4_COLKA|nr:TPR domain-containing protein [Colletotrichum kahawae]